MYSQAFSVAEFEQQCSGLSPAEWYKSLRSLADPMELARAKSFIPVLGITGAGKSTCINYLLGHTFEAYYSDDGFPAVRIQQAVPGEKLAKIGQSALMSETLYPDFFPLKTGHVLCDCPGFNDNRPPSKALTAFLGPQLALMLSSDVPAIIIAISYPEILAGRAEFLFGLLSDLSSFLRNSVLAFRSILFVITKAPEGYQPTHFLALVKEISKSSQGLGPASFFANSSSSQSLFCLENIAVLDVLDHGKSRNAILDRLTNVPFISKSSFTFENYGSPKSPFFRIIDRFTSYTTELISKRLELTQEIATLRYELTFLKRQYEEFENKKRLHQELKLCRAQLLDTECKHLAVRFEADALYAKEKKQGMTQPSKGLESLRKTAQDMEKEIQELSQKKTNLNQKILESSESGTREALESELLRRKQKIEELEKLLVQHLGQQKSIEDLLSALQPSITLLCSLLEGVDLDFPCVASFLSAANRLPLHFLSIKPYVSKKDNVEWGEGKEQRVSFYV